MGITLLGLAHNITAIYPTAIQREYFSKLWRYEGSIGFHSTPLWRGRQEWRATQLKHYLM
ncbi:hypothetical protein ATJ93_4247 [Halopiger aswanensis]|uniref:Uncharacterized protein n=1 Tax=Halopiger aswanensis TaxID=148449 RepID=A0A3R7D7B0_9EURY|nr:hypothetical protein ATJ93_4247 [Halopiger aswanensis]